MRSLNIWNPHLLYTFFDSLVHQARIYGILQKRVGWGLRLSRKSSDRSQVTMGQKMMSIKTMFDVYRSDMYHPRRE